MATQRLFLLSPEVIFRGRVNQASFTYPLAQVTFDGVTVGAYTDIKPGQTVLFGSTSGGDDLGRQRVRKLATSNTLYIGRSSLGIHDGEVNLSDNIYITVLDLHQVWAKMPYISPEGHTFKDHDLNADWGELIQVVANGGRPFAGTIDSGTGLVTVEFDGSDSYYFTNVGLVQPNFFSWDVADGTITVGTSSDPVITATFPAGFRYVTLTVTETGANTHVKYIPVFARDPEDDETVAFQVTAHRITPQGQEMSVRILSDIPRANYPDGTLAMIWEGEPADESGRSHMKFVGWVHSEDGASSAQRTGTLKDTTLRLLDVAGKLKTLPGFPQILQYSATPTKWTHTEIPNVHYYLHYLLYWHSTALEVADLLEISQTLSLYEFKVLGSDQDNLFSQANSLANNVTPDHHLTCNRYGQLMIVDDDMIRYAPDRGSTIYDNLDDTDWTEVRFTYQRAPRVHQLRSFAVTGNYLVITPIGSLAPGDAPGQGEGYIETSERIAFSQSALNAAEGNRYARINAPYGLFTITVPYSRLSNSNDPAYMGWVQLTVSANNQPQRTLPFTNQRGIVHEINITYDYQPTGLVRMATLTWEMETSGPAAQTLELEAAEV